MELRAVKEEVWFQPSGAIWPIWKAGHAATHATNDNDRLVNEILKRSRPTNMRSHPLA